MDSNAAAIQQAVAAWVQAIGALVALLIAIAFPAWQRYSEQRDRRHAVIRQNAVQAQILAALASEITMAMANDWLSARMPRRMLAVRSTTSSSGESFMRCIPSSPRSRRLGLISMTS